MGVEKRLGIHCNAHACNLDFNCYSLMRKFTYNDRVRSNRSTVPGQVVRTYPDLTAHLSKFGGQYNFRRFVIIRSTVVLLS